MSVRERSRAIAAMLNQYPILQGRHLEFVKLHPARHSELFEYRTADQSPERRYLFKQVRPGESVAVARHAFASLQYLHRVASPELKAGLPLPVASFETGFLQEKLSGAGFDRQLKARANVVIGPFLRERTMEVANRIGQWLYRFQQDTHAAPIPFQSASFCQEVDPWLEKCAARGLGTENVEHIRHTISFSAEKGDGKDMTAAAVHGDFLPQNIIADRSGIGVVDFENFRPCGPIHEDLGAFLAFLHMLSGSRLYSARTLRGMADSFLRGHGHTDDRGFCDLYMLKWAIVISADAPKAFWHQNRLRGWNIPQRLLYVTRQIVTPSGA